MIKYELSKYDFEALDRALKFYQKNGEASHRIEKLREQFAQAFTGWLETDEDQLDIGAMLNRVKRL